MGGWVVGGKLLVGEGKEGGWLLRRRKLGRRVWRGGWVGGWVGLGEGWNGWVEGEKGVGLSCAVKGRVGGWVGGRDLLEEGLGFSCFLFGRRGWVGGWVTLLPLVEFCFLLLYVEVTGTVGFLEEFDGDLLGRWVGGWVGGWAVDCTV